MRLNTLPLWMASGALRVLGPIRPSHVAMCAGETNVPAPCSDSASLLHAVVSKLPSGAIVSADQLRSLMGLHSRDLTGLPLKEVPGSFEVSMRDTLGCSTRPDDKLVVPEDLVPWIDPRPPAALRTSCLAALVPNTTTWITNDPERCDDLVAELELESVP